MNICLLRSSILHGEGDLIESLCVRFQPAPEGIEYLIISDGSSPAALSPNKPTKVTIVGAGAVGMACAYSILHYSTAAELVIADIMHDKVKGEVADFNHAGAFLHATVKAAGPNYEGTEGSDICIITAGVRQKEGETRLDLLKRNYHVMKSIVPPLVARSPNTLILVVSNPCDVLSYIVWKLSGLPHNRVFGSGTYLDSSRFRVLLASKLNINAQSVHAWIIGEHGDSSVAVWSSANIAGVPIAQFIENGNIGSWQEIHDQVVGAAYEVIKLKGYTNWGLTDSLLINVAIGAAVGKIVESIFLDSHRVIPLSTFVQHIYDIEDEVFFSLPCVVGRNGVEHVLNQPLNDTERKMLLKSASILLSQRREIDNLVANQ